MVVKGKNLVKTIPIIMLTIMVNIWAIPSHALVNNQIAKNAKLKAQPTNTHLATPEDPFLGRLKRGYIQLSEAEWKQQDKIHSKMYAQKAVSIMNGKPVLPKAVDKLKLPPAKIKQLQEARQFLTLNFENNLKITFPEAAAQAQLMFDCWVEQEIDGRKPQDIAYCKGGFEQVKSDITTFLKDPSAFPKRRMMAAQGAVRTKNTSVSTNISEPLAVGWPFTAPALTVSRDISTSSLAPMTSPIPSKAAPISSSKIVAKQEPATYKAYFARGQKLVTENNKSILDKVIQDALQYHPDRIQIVGYKTDPIEYTEQRVLSVASYLVEKGLNPELLDLRAYENMAAPGGNKMDPYCEIHFEKRVN